MAAKAATSTDRDEAARLYDAAIEFARDDINKETAPQPKADLEAAVLQLTISKWRRLMRLALMAKDAKAADDYARNQFEAFNDLYRFVQSQTANGTLLNDVALKPDEVLANRDEESADSLVALLNAGYRDAASVRDEIFAKIGNAKDKYERLLEWDRVAGCYETIGNFYDAIKDPANEFRNRTAAAQFQLKAAEGSNLTEIQRKDFQSESEQTKGTALFSYGMFLIPRSPQEPHQRLGEAAQALRSAATLFEEIDQAEDSRDANNSALLADVMKMVLETQFLLQKQQFVEAKGRVKEAQATLTNLDELSGGPFFAVATDMLTQLDWQMGMVEWVGAVVGGNWDAIEQSYDALVRSFNTARQRATDDTDRKTLDQLRAVADALQLQARGSRQLVRSDFAGAEKQFAESLRVANTTIESLDLANSTPELGSPSVFLKAIARLSNAWKERSAAQFQALTGRSSEAIAGLKASAAEYEGTRLILADSGAFGEPLAVVCRREAEIVTSLAGFLEQQAQQHGRPHLAIVVEAPESCLPGQKFTVNLKVQNISEVPATGVFCQFVVVPPDGIEVVNPTRMTKEDAGYAWRGEIGPRETASFRLRARALDRLQTCLLVSTCRYGHDQAGVLEDQESVEIEIVRPIVEWNLGGGIRLRLSEAQLFWLKVASYPGAGVLGVGLDRLWTRLFH